MNGPICATFIGGPWAGTYRVLEDGRDRWYVPILKPLSLRELSAQEAEDPSAHVGVTTGTYQRHTWEQPSRGLYTYHWIAPR